MLKRCCRCKEIKELNSFYKKTQSRDGYDWICKVCKNNENKKYKESIKGIIPEKDNFNDILGGYKIIILNYCKKSDFKYQIGGEKTFKTNNKKDFIAKLKEVLGEIPA